MLRELYRHAAARRDELVAPLAGADEYASRARRRWHELGDVRRGAAPSTLGVDGSLNQARFQGMNLWAVTAVAVTHEQRVLASRCDVGLDLEARLHDRMRRFELDVCAECAGAADLVFMDGSLHHDEADSGASERAELVSMIERAPETVFVSKSSSAQHDFGDAPLGDMYYYGIATDSAGFSEPSRTTLLGSERTITSTYARLSRSAPLVKVELLGARSLHEVRSLLASASASCVGGYPYALRYAHETCTITDEAIESVRSLIGTRGARGAREVLSR